MTTNKKTPPNNKPQDKKNTTKTKNKSSNPSENNTTKKEKKFSFIAPNQKITAAQLLRLIAEFYQKSESKYQELIKNSFVQLITDIFLQSGQMGDNKADIEKMARDKANELFGDDQEKKNETLNIFKDNLEQMMQNEKFLKYIFVLFILYDVFKKDKEFRSYILKMTKSYSPLLKDRADMLIKMVSQSSTENGAPKDINMTEIEKLSSTIEKMKEDDLNKLFEICMEKLAPYINDNDSNLFYISLSDTDNKLSQDRVISLKSIIENINIKDPEINKFLMAFMDMLNLYYYTDVQ